MIPTRYFLPESDDRVDPGFDFLGDTYAKRRTSGVAHDSYAHEILKTPHSDGILVTRSIISASRERAIVETGGIHQFLRLQKNTPVIADCGAFQYRDQEVPPYTPTETPLLLREPWI